MPLNVAQKKSHVPTSYAEVFTHYYPAIVGLVKKFHIDPLRREDVAMTILTKFIEKDVLSDFDPEYIGKNGQKMRFESFLSGFVVSYVRYFRERELIQVKRELTLIDTDPNSEDTEEEISWLDKRFIHVDDTSEVEYEVLVKRIRVHLKTLTVTTERNDKALLFDLILWQMEEYGRMDVEELSSLYGVTKTSIYTYIHRLRVEITKVMES